MRSTKPPIWLLMSATVASQLALTIFLPSMPALARSFDVAYGTAQLTLSVYLFAFAFAQLAVGPLSDNMGRRPVLLAGLATYVTASLLCGLSISMDMLITARFVQALGCCTAVMIARAIVRDAYAPEYSARVIARASTWLSMAPIIGPILGSVLQVSFGWRAAFAIPGLLAFACGIVFALKCPRETVAPAKRSGKAKVELSSTTLARVFLVMTATAVTSSILFNFTTSGNSQLLSESFAGVIEDPAVLGALLAALFQPDAPLAVKGIGGYHLICDADNEAVVAELRRRKARDAKPFAVMVANLASLDRIVRASAAERTLLASPAAPIEITPATVSAS